MKEERVIFLAAFLVFLIALALRLSYVNSAIIDIPLRADAAKYFRLAVNSVYHSAYSLADIEPYSASTYITPGYPLFLAVFVLVSNSIHDFYTLTLNSQALLGACSAAIVFALGLELGGLGVALMAGLLFAISPHHVIASGYVLTECLFTFLLLLSVLLCLRAVQKDVLTLFWIAGVAIAVASLVRPVLLLFPLLLFPILWKRMGRKSWPRLISLIFGMALALAPWQIWKTMNPVEGEPSQVMGTLIVGSYPDLIYKTPALRGYPYREDRTFDGKDPSSSIGIILQRAKSEPAKYLYWYAFGKPQTFWENSTTEGAGGPFIYKVDSSIYDRLSFAIATLSFMMATHFLWVSLAAVTCCYGLRHLFRSRYKDAASLVLHTSSLLLVYFTLIHSVLLPLPRYAYPVYPFVYLLAAFGVQVLALRFWHVVRKRRLEGAK